MKDTRVTPNEAAKLLGVPADRVRTWGEEGRFPSYRSVHGWRKIDRPVYSRCGLMAEGVRIVEHGAAGS